MVEIRNTPVSHGSLVAQSSLLASALAAHLIIAPPTEAAEWPVERSAVRLGGISATSGLTTFCHVNAIDQEIAAVYSDLLSKQQRLGPDFERVLLDNLWDLYER